MNRKMTRKKALALLISLLLLVTVFGSCGTDATTSASKKSGSEAALEGATVRIGSLKGPTSLGLLSLMSDADAGETTNSYEFTLATGADELLPLMIKGELDIALVPANVASTLYAKMEGELEVIDINTLGVLYIVSADDSVSSIPDLAGRTVYLTGMGTTPDYCLQYLLSCYGLSTDDVTLEYKSEASEVAAVLVADETAIGLLPQPYVTSACMQNDALAVLIDLNAVWSEIQGEDGSSMVTGVTVVRKAFLEENPDAITLFLADHAASVAAVNADPAAFAAVAVDKGILGSEAIATKAIPNCNLVCITGEDLQRALSGYLQVLYDFSPDTIGGALPGEDFYYAP